ncbi:hypothetical protein [Lentzea sp. E54]|uniref:hypothetical protein n=1 Tax=Lentzea xerophila TaxID=3435883 RepID=UPI003DA23F6E
MPDKSADDNSADGDHVTKPGLGKRLETFAGVAAPTTLATALLFYFGYVATLARYLHFGVDLSTLNLTTTEFLLLGTEVIFPAIAVLLVLTVAGWATHRGVRRVLAAGRSLVGRVLAIVIFLVGASMFVRGTIGVLSIAIARDEFPGITPLTFGLGLPIAAYGVWTLRGTGKMPAVLMVVLVGIATLGLFWATNSFAAAYGRGRANQVAAALHTRPAVVLDTKERLYLTLPGVTETALPASEGQTFRYRYRGLHVLIAAGGRLFLVPAHWNGTPGTVVVPYGDAARIQFFPG